MGKKILLIKPSSYRHHSKASHYEPILPSLGLLYIAAYLQRQGQSVKILDFDLDRNLANSLAHFFPDFIGVTSMSMQFPEAATIAKQVKDFNNKIITVLGGIHATACASSITGNYSFDYVVRGEGEIAFAKLVEGVDPSNIDGLCFPGHIAEPTYVKDLDLLPFPARSLIDLSKYNDAVLFKMREPHTTFMMSRGCGRRCIFCDHKNIGYYRVRSPENIIEELELLSNQGIRDLRMLDSLFVLNQEKTRNICQRMIERKIDITWNCQTRVDGLSADTLKLMKKAGCYNIQIGVETGSARTMKIIKKDIDLAKLREDVRIIRKSGISVTSFFMLGFPFESKEDILETIRYAKSLDANVVLFSIVKPLPSTELWEMSMAGKNVDIMEFLKTIQYYDTTSPFWNKKDLDVYFSKAYKDFYFNPKHLIDLLSYAFAGPIKRKRESAKMLLFGNPILYG